MCDEYTLNLDEFDAVGVVCSPTILSWEAYEAFVKRGLPDGLAYLERNAEVRRTLDRVLEGVRSVVSFAVCLPRAIPGWARFCAIGDYHEIMRVKIARFEAQMRQIGMITGQTRICVDSAPVLEREFAVRAGLGWIAANHMLVHPRFGAGLALGELLVTDDLTEHVDIIKKNVMSFNRDAMCPGAFCQCQNARRCCERACPTRALCQGNYDPARCLAYLTTQHTGVLEPEFARAMGECIWGCDRCQVHCPVARFELPGMPESPCVARYSELTPQRILSLSAKQLTKQLAGTPMADAHPRLLQRNACYVIANTKAFDQADLLRSVLASNPCGWVRESAAWGLDTLYKE